MIAKIRKLLSPDNATRTVSEIEAVQAEVRSEIQRLQAERARAQRERKARILEADAKELRELEGKASDLALELERAGVVLQRLDEELGAAKARERAAAREEVQERLEAKFERGRKLIEEYRKLAPKVVKVLAELDEIDRELIRLRDRQRMNPCPEELQGVAVPQPPSHAARTHRVPRLPEAAVIPPAAPDAPSWKGDRPTLDYADPSVLEREREKEAAWQKERARFREETEDLKRRGLRRVGVRVVTGPDGDRYDLSESKLVPEESALRQQGSQEVTGA
ncbi:MAG: hypothetical protein EA421_05380 [Gemmatimonadales bacterium]|nr:MAG: hypothetical protein EA421_05380 [Gemmatimonadales bacterium]